MAALAELASNASSESKLVPLNRFRFNMEGEVTLAQGIEYMRTALASLGYRVQVDEAELQTAGIDLDKMYSPQIKAAKLSEIESKFFRRAGLRMHRENEIVELLPIEHN